MNLIETRRRVNSLLSDHRHTTNRVREEKTALAEAKQEADDLTQARSVLQAVAEAVQRQAHRRIAGVVSRCLSAVFQDEAYQFKIDFQQKRGKTEARLLLVRDGLEIDPLDAAGGGVVDVASFALRLACLTMARPPLRRLIVADEPMKFLSAGHRPLVRHLFERLAKEMSLQIIMVTHSTDLICGKVIELS